MTRMSDDWERGFAAGKEYHKPKFMDDVGMLAESYARLSRVQKQRFMKKIQKQERL